jgi:hypothetical protein
MREGGRKVRGLEIIFVVGLLLVGFVVAVYLLGMPAPDGLGCVVGSAAGK